MKLKIFLLISITICAIAVVAILLYGKSKGRDDQFVSYTVDPIKQNLELYWKDDNGAKLKSIRNLKDWLASKNKQLAFAMNGGMYKPDNSPQGLFIENGKLVTPLDANNGSGNFYLKPNGVFYITNKNIAHVVTTPIFEKSNVKYATQSGPMLVINNKINPAFKKGSANLNIRNGVGILPNNKILFAMSKKEISFYDFASYFKERGCKNALYLDGLVSRTYLPKENWLQTDGNFGVMIGITNSEK